MFERVCRKSLKIENLLKISLLDLSISLSVCLYLWNAALLVPQEVISKLSRRLRGGIEEGVMRVGGIRE